MRFLCLSTVVLAFLSGGLACDPPSDIGTVCALPNPDGGAGLWTTNSATDDLFYSGTTECQNLVCLRPRGSLLDAGYGYCSNQCTPTNPQDDDSTSPDCEGATVVIDGQTEAMVCRQVALDQTFIDQLLDAGEGGLLEEYLGGTTPPVLCTTPE